jgi:hypothetical protein
MNLISIRSLFGFIGALSFLTFFACQDKSEETEQLDQADAIIQDAIESAGMELLDAAEASFVFRNRKYTYQRQGGSFEYTRTFRDTLNKEIVDRLTNGGHIRFTNGEQTDVPEKRAQAFSRSVNSVIYFAFLPYNLKDPAVNAEYAGKVNIKGQAYEKLRVTFTQETGGKDWEDVFYYWFDPDSYKMDYLAYHYTEDDGEVGIRFREAFNERRVAGVRIQDYHNYKPSKGEEISFGEIEQAFEEGRLELLSEIELTDVEIKPLSKSS